MFFDVWYSVDNSDMICTTAVEGWGLATSIVAMELWSTVSVAISMESSLSEETMGSSVVWVAVVTVVGCGGCASGYKEREKENERWEIVLDNAFKTNSARKGEGLWLLLFTELWLTHHKDILRNNRMTHANAQNEQKYAGNNYLPSAKLLFSTRSIARTFGILSI